MEVGVERPQQAVTEKRLGGHRTNSIEFVGELESLPLRDPEVPSGPSPATRPHSMHPTPGTPAWLEWAGRGLPAGPPPAAASSAEESRPPEKLNRQGGPLQRLDEHLFDGHQRRGRDRFVAPKASRNRSQGVSHRRCPADGASARAAPGEPVPSPHRCHCNDWLIERGPSHRSRRIGRRRSRRLRRRRRPSGSHRRPRVMEIPSIGRVSGSDPAEPKNGAPPKVKTPPSEATSQ